MPAATALAATTPDELLSNLAGHPSTDGWDVVCSYSVNALNQILQKAHEARSLATTLSFSAERTDPIDDTPFTESFELVLGAPTLDFIGTAATCVLTMPIANCDWKIVKSDGTPGRSGTIGPGYSLVATVPLAAMYADGTAAKGSVVTWDAGDGRKAHVVVHFAAGAGSGTTWAITPEPPRTEKRLIDAIPYIDEHFATRVDALDYQLTGIDPAPPARTDGEVVLTAKSFAFSTSQGVLSLFVQTTNSGRPAGNPDPVFRAGGKEMPAVPDGHQASVIFARDLVKQVYVGPGLAKSGTVKWDDTVTKGIAANVVLPTPPVKYNPSHLGQSQLQCDTLVIDYSKLPYHLVLQDRSLSLSWRWSQTVNWRTDDIDLRGGGSIKETGRTKFTLTIAKARDLPAPTDTEVGAWLSIVPNDYHLTTEGPTGWWSSGPGITLDINAYLASHAQPTIGISLGGLHYFTVANLLFGGQQRFAVDAVAGTNVPADVVIFGRLAEGS